MAAKKHPKQKQATPFARAVKALAAVAALLGALTLFVSNLDKLGELWRKYFGPKPIAELQHPRNLPSELYGSSAPVQVELVQAADQEQNGRAYDLYLENNGPNDLLLSEVRFGPGVAYASTGETSGLSGTLPTVSYRVVTSGSRGAVALSPPYRLGAHSRGALRVVIQAGKSRTASHGTVAFELYSAGGDKVASVNRMLGE
jgi:hypothetical protein